jgi:hypothetical protein
MAVMESLHQFRFAAMFLAPWEYESGKFTQSDLDENARRYWKLWLTRSAVEGLQPSDFSALTPEQAGLLTRSRDEFLANVPMPGDGPTTEQMNRARAAFLTLFPIVQKYLYDQPTLIAAGVLRQIVREQKYGKWFVGVDFALGDDSTGDPALWAWLIVAEETPDDTAFQQEWPHIRQWIQEELRIRGIPDRYAYLHLRTAEEQRELLAGNWE